jgi:DNA-binding transcriptional MerR regulator
MAEYYTPADAERLTGISRPAVRAYANRYARWLSTEASPPSGQARRFRADDLRVLAFVYRQSTEESQQHEAIAATLEASNGVPDDFAWRVPEEEHEQQPGAAPTALVPVGELRAAQALMTDSRNREQIAVDQVVELQRKVEDLQREIGRLEGELAFYRRRRPGWVRRLFGE